MHISILDIKRKADFLSKKYYKNIYMIFLLVNALMVFIHLVSNSIISIILSFITVTTLHAYVIVSMKLIKNEPNTISVKDVLVGYKSFKKIFPAYLMRKIILSVINIVILIPGIFLISQQTKLTLMNLIDWIRVFMVGGMETSLTWIMQGVTSFSNSVVFLFFVAIIITTVFSYGFALVPYLLETYDIAWNEALIQSWHLMKTHKRELLILQIMYVPRIILVNIITNLLLGLIGYSYIFGSLAIYFYIYTPILLWIPQMQVANALFFEVLKVDDEAKNSNQLFRSNER